MIKARVILKSQILSWSKTWSMGTFFKLCLADESGEIEAIAFGDHLVEMYFDMFEVSFVYYKQKSLSII